MSFNGSGTFVINSAGQPVVANTVISATVFNALTADLATGLTNCITKDGQSTPTANIPMGNNKITGLGAGTAATDAATLGQVQSTAAKLITVTGTDTISGTMSPALTAYAAGQLFYFIANAANTGAMTINIDGLGAKNITRDGSTALVAGDVNSGEIVVICYDGTRFQMINAANSFGNTTINGTLTVTGKSDLPTVSTASINAAVAVVTTGTVTNLTATSASVASMNAGVALLTTATVTTLTATGASIASANIGNLQFTAASIASINAGVAVVTNLTATSASIASMNGSVASITTVNATTVDATNVEVTNVKAKDGTSAITISDSSGNVGIGGTASAPLTVLTNNGTDDSTARVAILGLSNPNQGQIEFRSGRDDGTVSGRYSSIQAWSNNLASARDLVLQPSGGNVGIGGAAGAGELLQISGTLPSSGTVSRGLQCLGVMPSSTTAFGIGYSTFLLTEAASFTLSNLPHFYADQGTIGAGSTVTNQYGFYVNASLTGATNNYGFYSNIASGSGRYNFFANGSADNYFAGRVGIGTSSPSALLDIAKTEITAYNGSATDGQLSAGSTLFVRQVGANNNALAQIVFQPRVSQPYNRIVSSGGSAPFMAFATNNEERLRITSAGNVGIGTSSPGEIFSIYKASDPAIRLESTAGNMYIVNRTSSTTMEIFNSANGPLWFGTNNQERLRIDASGNVGIGGTASALTKVDALGTYPTSGGFTRVFRATGTTPSGTTSAGLSHITFQSLVSTQAASFTMPGLAHFQSEGVTIGAGSTVTNQYGFSVASTLTGATNNYGFYSNIASGSGRYNFYAAGSAASFFSGSVGVGTLAEANQKLSVGGTYPTSATVSIGVISYGTIPSGSTSSGEGFRSQISTQAASFTVTNFRHFYANQGTIGAGSTVTNQYGYVAESSLTGATNNFGFYSNIAAGSNRWSVYAAGTAKNYFAGNVGIGVDPGTNTFAAVGAAGANATYALRSASGYGTFLTMGVNAGNLFEISVSTAGDLSLTTNGVSADVMKITRASSVSNTLTLDKGNVVSGSAAIATTATDGFLYVPTCAGTPTGTPTTYTGRAPIVVDTTNNKLYFYSGGTWRDAGP